MHRHERRERMAELRNQIRKSDVQGWAAGFLAALDATQLGAQRGPRRDVEHQ